MTPGRFSLAARPFGVGPAPTFGLPGATCLVFGLTLGFGISASASAPAALARTAATPLGVTTFLPSLGAKVGTDERGAGPPFSSPSA